VPARGAVVALDLDTRCRAERAACAIVRRAFSARAAKGARILFKKIDSTLRGHVAAELSSASRALGGKRPVLFAPAFPAQGRIVRDARLRLGNEPRSGDLRALLAHAGLPATHVDLATIRGRRPRAALNAALRAALATGARALVCDAESDADLDALARAGLALRPRPLFVGSAGLARALARTSRRTRPARRKEILPRPIITVVGSASPVSVGQAARLSRSRVLGKDDLLVQLEWTREPASRDISVVRRLGRIVAEFAPPAHYVLAGGATARAVLSAHGIRELRLLGEVEPGVPFGLARDGTLVCTKAGAFGAPDTLARCVARLKREMKRS
jgi:4-hydroxythreonine-4-phosphate dehydrogenase